MGPRSACLAFVVSLAFVAPAYGQSESGSGTVVAITQPGSGPTQVGASTGEVTSTTSATPAGGGAVPIATATPATTTTTGTATATATPTPTAAAITTTNTPPVENTATEVRSPGVVVTDVTTTSDSRSPTTTSASTTSTSTVSTTEIDLRKGRQRQVQLTVRDGRSKSKARRQKRRQTTVGEASVGSASPRAAAEQPAVDLEQRVTVDRIKVRSRSEARGKRVSTRRSLDVRNLVVKASDDTALLTIRRATLTRDGKVRLSLRTGTTGEQVVTIRAGADLLDPLSYRGELREAIEQVRAALAADTATGQVLDGLQLRLGAGSLNDGKRRSSGRIDGLTIRVGTSATGSDARASLPGIVEAVIGRAESAAQVINAVAVRLPEAAVSIGEAVGTAASVTKTFFIRPPKLRFERPRVLLRGDELHVVLTCTSAVSGVLALALGDLKLPPANFRCEGEARLKVKLSPAVARKLRSLVPATLTATVSATTPGSVAFRAPESLRLIVG